MFLSISFLSGGILFLILLKVCHIVFQERNELLQISRLGDRAPRIPTRLPLALDFMYDLIVSFSKDHAIEFWTRHFGNNLTVELFPFGGGRSVFTMDPENIKAIHATQFNDYGKGERFHAELRDFLGDGVFTTDGTQWSSMRQLIRPMFIKDKVQDFESLKRHTDILIQQLPRGQYVRFDDLLHRFTMDAATEYLFGRSVNSLTNPDVAFAKAFNEVQAMQMARLRAGPFKMFMSKKKFLANIRTLESLIEPYIQEAISYQEDEKTTSSGRPETFVHALAQYTKERSILRDELLAMLLAGRDTTACLLSWCFYELSRNPDIYAKLRKEVLDAISQDGPTYKDLKNMKYMSCVINETLRYYPPLPFNVRSTLTDTTLPTGGGPDKTSPVGVSANTEIGYPIILLHRNPIFYPPRHEHPFDPNQWCPDRWLSWNPKPWHFIPFGGGPRICIGQNFATIEASYVLARFVQEFDTVLDGNARETKVKMEIMLSPKDGVRVAFDTRS